MKMRKIYSNMALMKYPIRGMIILLRMNRLPERSSL